MHMRNAFHQGLGMYIHVTSCSEQVLLIRNVVCKNFMIMSCVSPDCHVNASNSCPLCLAYRHYTDPSGHGLKAHCDLQHDVKGRLSPA